jgi:antitoxin (DNA-binding transcriptional repressor) of toxin-antitoxin stability system
MTRITVTEAVRRFSDYVNRVAYRGERFVLVRGGTEVAELRPVARGLPLGDLPGLLASLPPLDPAERSEFAADVGRAREQAGLAPERSAWER